MNLFHTISELWNTLVASLIMISKTQFILKIVRIHAADPNIVQSVLVKCAMMTEMIIAKVQPNAGHL